MESLYLLIPIAIVLVCIAVAVFLWAVKSDQFEDLERQGHNILFDDDKSENDKKIRDKTPSKGEK
ncbi:cbb3-type cytochrome oxidase assembly protein CcoS [Vibrio genomosp. F10]|uniref:Cytochrome oxidase maturation protein, cbb3-type n=1 Tax=Vibrio genomosp. F10 TaxID=723171 RepID=A0A1B9QV53_9VIBR|nr:cbb3-type cytochrome oxidase assembly protein CcoS [Vibrio genomosp. F10]OCH72726.1 cytochrome oxidase maturation protein, cbb3-type [Vibrio genomosp. F10]OEE95247.1 cytochrome oxidase maturation protein, cbb3-type [Vibrio genomosp. F10 str. 9ZD137]OEF05178.1 cytochrome oxidase maturation protein, cbb3-type [Vibrio genomosp. F10 str. 9ZB36]